MIGRKILFVARMLDVGGAQRQLVELATGLRRSGWKVAVVVFYAGGALEQPLIDAGVSIIKLHKRGRWDVLPFLWRLVKSVRRECPDIIHGYLDLQNILAALLRPFVNKALVVWGVRASNMDFSRYDWLAGIEFRLGVCASRFAHLIICNSVAGLAHHVACGYPRDRMVVVPNGIDVARFKPDELARHEIRAEWGIDVNEILIGLVGRLDPMKDHVTFLNAAAKLAVTRPAARFVCVGTGPSSYEAALKLCAADLRLGKRLLWAGERTDMSRVYNALDIAVSSSSSGEGFPNSVAEAMATGVACVVTDVGDSSRVVGNVGWICPPQNADALVRAMAEAIDALPHDAKAVRQRICAEYSASALVERTMPYLSQLLGNASPCSATS